MQKENTREVKDERQLGREPSKPAPSELVGGFVTVAQLQGLGFGVGVCVCARMCAWVQVSSDFLVMFSYMHMMHLGLICQLHCPFSSLPPQTPFSSFPYSSPSTSMSYLLALFSFVRLCGTCVFEFGLFHFMSLAPFIFLQAPFLFFVAQ